MTTPTKVETRRRDSADSRQRLLDAARELFAERGYDGTTVRELGRRAGVDPTMIARYFGGKSALYLESLRPDGRPARVDPLDVTDPDEIIRLLERVQHNGPLPTIYSAVRPHEDPELQQAAIAVLQRYIVEPTARTAESAGVMDPRLRAEIITAALAGIVLSRRSGAFAGLSDADPAQVSALVAALCASLVSR